MSESEEIIECLDAHQPEQRSGRLKWIRASIFALIY